MERAMRRSLARVAMTIAIVHAGMRLAGGQVISGTVEGRVKDAQGGMLPATITAVNTATAASFVAATTSEGLYRIPFLPSGTYDIRADSSGFRTETKTGVVV